MGTKVATRNGSVGPHHDPYSWDELEVQRLGHTVVLRNCGLRSDTLTIDGKVEVENCTGCEAEQKFEEVIGFSSRQMFEWYMESRYRCSCGNKHLDCNEGFPGEILYICPKCEQIVCADFDESAII